MQYPVDLSFPLTASVRTFGVETTSLKTLTWTVDLSSFTGPGTIDVIKFSGRLLLRR